MTLGLRAANRFRTVRPLLRSANRRCARIRRRQHRLMIRKLTAGAEESRVQKSRIDGDAMGHPPRILKQRLQRPESQRHSSAVTTKDLASPSAGAHEREHVRAGERGVLAETITAGRALKRIRTNRLAHNSTDP